MQVGIRMNQGYSGLGRNLGCMFFLLLSLLPARGFAEESQGIVVWRLEAKEGVTEKHIDSLSGLLTSQVEHFSERRILSEADINTILRGEETRQRCGGEATNCIAEIGNALGVPEAVSGDLGKVESIWILNLRRIHVKDANVIKRTSRQVEGSLSTLVKALPEVVAELFDKEYTPPPSEVTQIEQDPETDTHHDNEARQTRLVWAHSLFWPGLALTALGGAGLGLASSYADDYNKTLDSNAKSKNGLWGGIGIGGLCVGGAALIAGSALFIVALTGEDESGTEGSQALDWHVLPYTDGQSVNAGILGRW